MTLLVSKVAEMVLNIQGYFCISLNKKMEITELISNKSELVSNTTWLLSNMTEYIFIFHSEQVMMNNPAAISLPPCHDFTE